MVVEHVEGGLSEAAAVAAAIEATKASTEAEHAAEGAAEAAATVAATSEAAADNSAVAAGAAVVAADAALEAAARDSVALDELAAIRGELTELRAEQARTNQLLADLLQEAEGADEGDGEGEPAVVELPAEPEIKPEDQPPAARRERRWIDWSARK